EPAAPPGAEPATQSAPLPDKSDDVLVLDSSMLVPEEEPAEPAAAALPVPEPAVAPMPMPMPVPAVSAVAVLPLPAGLLAPETEAAATSSVGTLVRTLATERTTQVHRGGPTIEDLVREELRPLLKQWLDANLPDLVERLVRSEIERVVHRATP
ncbi:MAG TPA: DUF2497 domain-containing protein, partial [Acetobacteraceae bacterium]|nr:DUF2497 domain-containing protein [Acetobacteraceae bacterium]